MTPKLNWTCEQTEARLSDYLDGLLSSDERSAFLGHVPSCQRCQPLFVSVSHLVSGLHSIADVEEPPHLVYAILDKTLGPREKVTGWQAFLRWTRGFATVRFAYGAASVAVTFLMLATAAGFNWRHPKAAALHPANIYRFADGKAHLAYAKGVKFISDLRVVNEIQSRMRENQQLPVNTEDSLPQRAPGKEPGSTDSTQPGPRQQNRADGIYRNLEALASQMPVFSRFYGGGSDR